MDHALIEKIRREIENFEPTASYEQVGTVMRVGDGIVEIEGLSTAMMSELVYFEDASGKLEDVLGNERRIPGMLLNLEEDSVKAVVLGDGNRIKEGMLVKSTGTVVSIPVSDDIVGRVVDALGRPIDGKGELQTKQTYPIERVAYGVIDRASVNTPVHTGIKAIDGMIPIGRGQRELIIGDRYTGKTSIAVDTILNQLHEPKETRPICIYVAIGQKESKVARLVGELAERGAMEYTIVVVASASAPAALQFLAPYAGATIGEHFMDQGKDAIVIYDDLSKHAVAYRQMSLLLRRPPGREAYPGDVFYLHSRLLERAAKLSNAKGGGSLTALPIIETQQGDVSGYIPTNVISITDGQIFLDAELFNKNARPAVNIGISVSRVGSSAQTKAMKKVASRIRIELAQFRELEAFMQFASDLDPDTKARIDKGRRLSEVLKQDVSKPMPFEEQVVSIYAANSGALDRVAVERVGEFEQKFLAFMRNQESEVLNVIRDSRELASETEEKLKESITRFSETSQELFS